MGAECSKGLLESLMNGVLVPIVERVKDDLTLDIELRDNGIELYYRGAQLMRVKEKEITKSNNELVKGISFPSAEVTEENVTKWIEVIPKIKDCLDRGAKNGYTTGPKGAELETEQIIVRENNLLMGKSFNTDYYITDIERDVGNARFDLVAVKSVKGNGKGPKDRRTPPKKFAVIELKYDVDALLESTNPQAGKEKRASLRDHFRSMKQFLEDNKNLVNLGEITKAQYNFKYDLDLIDNSGGSLKRIEEDHKWEKPEYIIILANFDQHYIDKNTKTKRSLKQELLFIKDNYSEVFKAFDVKFATSCGMGYALFNRCMKSFDEFMVYLSSLE